MSQIVSQTKLLYELLARGHDAAMIVEVAATIIVSLELMLTKERKRTERAHALPETWTLPDEGRSYALGLGWSEGRVAAEAQKFHDWARKTGTKYIDWAAAWRNWCTSQYQQKSPPAVSDLRVQRKERMSDAIGQLALFGSGADVQPRAGGGPDRANVVGFPAAGGQRP